MRLGNQSLGKMMALQSSRRDSEMTSAKELLKDIIQLSHDINS